MCLEEVVQVQTYQSDKGTNTARLEIHIQTMNAALIKKKHFSTEGIQNIPNGFAHIFFYKMAHFRSIQTCTCSYTDVHYHLKKQNDISFLLLQRHHISINCATNHSPYTFTMHTPDHTQFLSNKMVTSNKGGVLVAHSPECSLVFSEVPDTK